MKVAIVGESPADEAAVATIVAALLGEAIDVIPVAVRHGSWPKLRNVLPSVMAEVYYHTDAAAMVIVADADDSSLHDASHDPSVPLAPACRICDLLGIIAKVRTRLRDRPVESLLRIALGLAVPCIEAWLLCGIDHSVSEAAWVNARRQGKTAYSRLDLKRRLYGSDRPSLDQEIEAMVREAKRLAAGQLQLLSDFFPVGFGLLAGEVATWRQPASDAGGEPCSTSS